MHTYQVADVSEDMSFLEMLDVLNEQLTVEGEDPIAFDSDCREGICGMCGLVINGLSHGPGSNVTTCQVHMRSFSDGDVIDVEPWRAEPFTVIKDLVVDRSSFDRIIQAGGYITAPTGTAPEANSIPVNKADADAAFDAATCIGCGACVAACPNGSASLLLAAKAAPPGMRPQCRARGRACPNGSASLCMAPKVAHLGMLPQGQPERHTRVLDMVAQHDAEGFGGCTQIGECTAACPKDIQIDLISRMDRDVLSALSHRK